MKRFISFSGGVESTTMCILYGKDAKAIWADTGSEHSVMYERINYVENRIKEIHPKFEIIKVKGFSKHKGEEYDTLDGLTMAYKFMPTAWSRYCTRIFKIEPIDNFLKSQGECELMIGFNVDEENDREGNFEMCENVNYRYPLVEEGYTRDDCENILLQYDLHPNFPVYMLRGGCKRCPFKREVEYKAMYFLNKPEFLEGMKFEEEVQDKRSRYFTILSNRKSMRQLMEECEREKQFMGAQNWDEIYKSYKKGTSCGAFCHR